ncbi:alanyl-tRNA editing protein [Ornithinibacillus sp. L9]|uniref:Alanine--tRNA ligase n=1 Tax=Ornithinibacillus caprae TaxID=2678566 RepID=A0A6N8FGU9_9BACI|nr:DHHA1 domain-containing protein [Ornithinibacillus caprae]MUK87916.1 alanyl-tRNA editing protein [Ornithinibacillus caprae]
MNSEKLYYQDQYITSFTANVLKSEIDDQGRYYVVLDQTAFYPTGGGQPHDLGMLNDINVYGVEEIEGEIRHFTEEPIEIDTMCTGEIEWERRFDHMQQHAGQHILSAAFVEEFDYKTASFHLGKEICSIDLDVANLSEGEATRVENLANDMILDNRPIETKWVTEEELSNYKLRKELSVSENIRLVIIPEFDYNGCGGTHPSTTGQVSAIKVLHWEKQKKKTRVYFVCGKRVMKQLSEKHQVIQGLTSLLSAPQENLEKAANQVLQQSKQYEKEITDLKMHLIKYEAKALLEQAQLINGQKMVQAVFQNRPVPELQHLAKVIVANTNDTVVLFVNENVQKLQMVCAKGSDLSLSMNQLVKQVLPIINGKGGGTDSIAQGGGDKLVSAEGLMEKLVKSI